MRSVVALSLVALVLAAGCGTLQKAKESDALRAELARQKAREVELADALKEKDAEVTRLLEAHRKVSQENRDVAAQIDELAEAQARLQQTLQQQLADYQAKLTRTERGLVITFLAEILFDSGKAVIKLQAYPILDKVAEVLSATVPDHAVAIEGHTDNDPIARSGWKSNWELSSSRALAVLHYFIDTRGLPPARFQVNGFGEYQPVASNGEAAGRSQNRRVEVVILPALTKSR